MVSKNKILKSLSKQDMINVDEYIDIFRKFAKAKTPIPQSFSTCLDNYVLNSFSKSVYYHKKLLRYPTIKNQLISELNSIDSEENEMPLNTGKKLGYKEMYM
jgi:hypothetical protein